MLSLVAWVQPLVGELRSHKRKKTIQNKKATYTLVSGISLQNSVFLNILSGCHLAPKTGQVSCSPEKTVRLEGEREPGLCKHFQYPPPPLSSPCSAGTTGDSRHQNTRALGRLRPLDLPSLLNHPWMEGAARFHTPHPRVSTSPPQPQKTRHSFCDRMLRGNADRAFFKAQCPRGPQAGGNCCWQTPPQTELPDPQAKHSHLHLQSLKLDSTGNSAPQPHKPHFQGSAPSVTTGTHPGKDQCGKSIQT